MILLTHYLPRKEDLKKPIDQIGQTMQFTVERN